VNPWPPLDDELDAWRAAGRQPTLWWRDDDACRLTPALQRLLDTAIVADVPVALAAVPALLEPSLGVAVEATKLVTVVQHGYAHRNHAPPGARNWELGGHRPIAVTVKELLAGRAELERNFGCRFVRVLVPPWNRIDPDVVARLPEAGFGRLSTFGPRNQSRPAPGVEQSNTHVDLIAWRRGRAFIGAVKAVERIAGHLRARREGRVDTDEPTGILTHHLDFDDDAWAFLSDIFRRTSAQGFQWLDVEAVFAQKSAAGTATSSRSA